MADRDELILVPVPPGGDVGHAVFAFRGNTYIPPKPGGDVGHALREPSFEHYVGNLDPEEAITVELYALDDRAVAAAHEVASRHHRLVVLRRIEA
jgi:hypothetical protein